jgi:hypothetical protein
LLTYLNHSDVAVIVLHEIYGINKHILSICNKYDNLEYDVYCPDLIHRGAPFDYCRQEAAYQNLKTNVGFDVYWEIEDLLKKLRTKYRIIVLIGFISLQLRQIHCCVLLRTYKLKKRQDNIYFRYECCGLDAKIPLFIQ